MENMVKIIPPHKNQHIKYSLTKAGVRYYKLCYFVNDKMVICVKTFSGLHFSLSVSRDPTTLTRTFITIDVKTINLFLYRYVCITHKLCVCE